MSFIPESQFIPLSSPTMDLTKTFIQNASPDDEQFLIGQIVIFKGIKYASVIFKNKNLSELDPLVSDCACHTRAIYFAYLAKKAQLQEEFNTIAPLLDREIKSLQKQLLKKSLPESSDFNVSQECIALTAGYLLTVTKVMHKSENELREKTEESKLSSGKFHKKLSSKMAKEIVKNAKEVLSSICCSFLLKKGATIPSLEKMLDERNIQLIHKRAELPCLYSMQAVCAISKNKQIPIIVKIRQTEHTFECSKEPFEFAFIIKENDALPEGPVIVIDGAKSASDEPFMHYVQRFLSHGIEDICSMAAAHHKQYSTKGSTLSDIPLLQHYPEEKEKAEYFLQKASEVGCHNENPLLFTIHHIFCSTVEEQYKKYSTLFIAD